MLSSKASVGALLNDQSASYSASSGANSAAAANNPSAGPGFGTATARHPSLSTYSLTRSPSPSAPTASSVKSNTLDATATSPTILNAPSSVTSSSGHAQQPVKRKHTCPTCDKSFTTSGHLARHTRVHTGERNHKCPFPGCDTRCSRQDNLQQHYRIHLSPGSRRSSSSATRAAMNRALEAQKEPNGGGSNRSNSKSMSSESPELRQVPTVGSSSGTINPLNSTMVGASTTFNGAGSSNSSPASTSSGYSHGARIQPRYSNTNGFTGGYNTNALGLSIASQSSSSSSTHPPHPQVGSNFPNPQHTLPPHSSHERNHSIGNVSVADSGNGYAHSVRHHPSFTHQPPAHSPVSPSVSASTAASPTISFAHSQHQIQQQHHQSQLQHSQHNPYAAPPPQTSSAHPPSGMGSSQTAKPEPSSPPRRLPPIQVVHQQPGPYSAHPQSPSYPLPHPASLSGSFSIGHGVGQQHHSQPPPPPHQPPPPPPTHSSYPGLTYPYQRQPYSHTHNPSYSNNPYAHPNNQNQSPHTPLSHYPPPNPLSATHPPPPHPYTSGGPQQQQHQQQQSAGQPPGQSGPPSASTSTIQTPTPGTPTPYTPAPSWKDGLGLALGPGGGGSSIPPGAHPPHNPNGPSFANPYHHPTPSSHPPPFNPYGHPSHVHSHVPIHVDSGPSEYRRRGGY